MFQDFTKITKFYPSEKLDNECRHISFLNYSPKIPSFLIFSYCIIISIINLTDEDSMPSTAKHFFNIFTSPIIIDKKKKKKIDLFLTRIDPIIFLFCPFICFIHRFIDDNIYLCLSQQIR